MSFLVIDLAEETKQYCSVIHRADYHRVLLDKAESLGVEIKLGIDVKQVDFEQTKVITSTGKSFYGDVIVGADGMSNPSFASGPPIKTLTSSGIWSILRDQLLGYPSPPQETGDLAYRATFSRASLESLEDPSVTAFINKNVLTLWLGAGSHAVFYPIRSGQEFNLVLACPDDLPPSVRKQPGNLEQMFEFFKDWDPILSKIISKAGERQVLKWKLLHHHELERWTKGTVALLGDACHPSLPYQAQGAAMAVEDAAVLGTLLGLYKDSLSSLDSDKIPSVPDVLSVYEALQKERSTINVRGAISNRDIYHMHDGPEQEERDRILKAADWVERDVEERFVSVDPKYWRKMLGRDSVADAKKAWEEFLGSLGVEK